MVLLAFNVEYKLPTSLVGKGWFGQVKSPGLDQVLGVWLNTY